MSPGGRLPGAAGGRERPSGSGSGPLTKAPPHAPGRRAAVAVDVHAHYMPAGLAAAAGSPLSAVPQSGGGEPLHDLSARADWMRKRGIAVQVLGPEMRIARYDAAADEAALWSRRVNEGMAEAARGSANFVALATVPMQDGELAARELRHAAGLGCRGAMIHTGVPGGLHAPGLDPFWSAASDLAVPVLVHSGAPADPRLDELDLASAIGRPHEISIGAAQLVFGGVLDRFPDLQPVLLMGGGELPYLVARLRAGAKQGSFAAAMARHLSRFNFDTVLYGAPQLRLLLEAAGPERIMIGSDWPISPHEEDPVGLLDSLALSDQDRDAILAGNAARLFHVEGA